MSLTLGYLLATVAAQAGSACFNCKRSAKQAKDLARKQHEYEERVLRDGIENSRQEFAEICTLQREIEQQMQRDRLQLIRDSYHSNLMLEAYRHSLNNWPLFVPPFVIKNECLPILENDEQGTISTIPVNCILTPSADNMFNLKVFSLLEEQLAQFFSHYWPTNSVKAIRFYQQAWRNNITDVGAMMHDLKAHLSEVPTIVLSPMIENESLLFSFSWWGFSGKIEDEHILEADSVYNPEIKTTVMKHMEYNQEIIDSMLKEITPKLAAFISYFADLYYWEFYRMPPTLPLLISQGDIKIVETSEYSNQYSDLFDRYLQGTDVPDYLSNIWLAFSPALINKPHFIDSILTYVKKLPDYYKVEQNEILYVIENLNLTSSQKEGLGLLKTEITSLQEKQYSECVNFKFYKYKSLTLKDIIDTMIPIGRTLPKHDTFNVIVNKNKLYALAYFSLGENVITWENKGICIFQSPSLIVPNNIFNKTISVFACPAQQLSDLSILLEKIMTNKEIIGILDARYNQLKESLIPVSSKLEDVFAEFVSQIKSDLAKEFKNRETEEFNRQELKYEEIVKWLRQARDAMGNQPFDGAFLTKQKAGLFDKYPYKMYICLTKDKQPLVEANHPKGVFCYAKTDDSIDDMFGKNNSIQLNFT